MAIAVWVEIHRDLPAVIDAGGPTVSSAKRGKVLHCAVAVEESVVGAAAGGGTAHDLAAVVYSRLA